MAEPRVCVAIVTYDSGATIEACLRSLGAQTWRGFEVVVVDNGLTPGLKEMLKLTGAPTRLIEPGANLGFAAGNNRAAEAASADTDWLACLNPDAFADPGWLAAFVAAAARYPDCAAFASVQRMARAPETADGLGDCYHAFGIAWRGGYGRPLPESIADGEVFAACGAAAFYRLDAFRAAGGFDESYFAYVEDVDLGFRLRLAGHRCILIADARVDHVGGASAPSGFAVRHGARNLLRTFVKDMPQPLFALMLPFHAAATIALLVNDWRKGRGGPHWAGLSEGLTGLRAAWASRRAVQTARRARLRDVARALVWSPWALAFRPAAVRPPRRGSER